ncbi:MAG TPA: SMC-Scp complex subunit ScpB [Polyangiaceae bacterium]|nr:SMC-Scp complex subunit ScpB [Polyangiaceae bacterium]
MATKKKTKKTETRGKTKEKPAARSIAKASPAPRNKPADSKVPVGKRSEKTQPSKAKPSKPAASKPKVAKPAAAKPAAAKPAAVKAKPSKSKSGPGVVRAKRRESEPAQGDAPAAPTKTRGKAQLRVVTQPPPSETLAESHSSQPDSAAALSEADAAVDDESYLLGLLEALLFCSDHPVEVKELARAAGLDRKRTVELLQRLIELYAHRGLRLEHVAEGYSFRTHPRYGEFVRKLLAARPVRLSRAQLETLAIIAYRQPVTRPDVDDIRGVDSGPVLKGLLERDLVKIIGKKDEPGRPILYGTSKGFLELFNLTSLADLPTLRDFVELSEESRRKFAEETGEDAPEEPLSELAAAAASAETGEMAEANLAAAAIAETDAAETKAEASDEADDEESDDDDEDEESDDDDDEDEESDDDDDEDEESDDDDDEDEESDDDDDEDEESDDDDDDEDEESDGEDKELSKDDDSVA